MSKTDKMRGRLASIQKDRENFERQKKELEADMHVGKRNMTKIQKGLKNNTIADEDLVIDHKIAASPAPNGGAGVDSPYTGVRKGGTQGRQTRAFTPPKDGSGHPRSDRSPNGSSPTNSGLSLQGTPSAHGKSMGGNFFPGGGSVAGEESRNNSLSPRNPAAAQSQSGVILPSGPRISEWSYTAPLDTIPPVVKSRAMYENVRHLGRGAFGEVSLVKNVEDNKLFAIKTQLCPKDSEFQSVLHEVRFLRANRHPCIIDVHDAFLMLNPRIVHIVMHYCESGTLATTIQSARKNRTNFAETQVIKWMFQMALALQFLHDNKTIHRDLKPMNVMLTEGGEHVKIGDFGLAMSVKDDSRKEAVDEAGTPYYTAPEMIMREPYSCPADCWSFGIIVHQMLSLVRPFDGSSTADLVKAILTGKVPALPAHYSEDIKLISYFLLRREPSERLTMTELLAHPLLFPKASSFPGSYRPRALEERIRRQHTKQLDAQLENINLVRKKFTPLNERAKLIENFDFLLGTDVAADPGDTPAADGSAAAAGDGVDSSAYNSPDNKPVLPSTTSSSSSSKPQSPSAVANSSGSTPAAAAGAAAGATTVGATTAAATGATASENGNILSGIESVSDDVSLDDPRPALNADSMFINNSVAQANDAESSMLKSRSADNSPRVVGIAMSAAVDSGHRGVIPPRLPTSPRSQAAVVDAAINNTSEENETDLAASSNREAGSAAAAAAVDEGNSNSEAMDSEIPPHAHGGRKGIALAKAIETDEYFEQQIDSQQTSPHETPPAPAADIDSNGGAAADAAAGVDSGSSEAVDATTTATDE